MIREGKLQGVGKPSLKVSENRRTIKIDSQKEGIKMKLVFVRHGESEWNALNLFTGWSNVELTQTLCRECEVNCIVTFRGVLG